MWYVSSPEKCVTPGIDPDTGGVGVEVMWGGSGGGGGVRVEPGPAIFYLTTSSVVEDDDDDDLSLKREVKMEEELLGSVPFAACSGSPIGCSLNDVSEAQGNLSDETLGQEYILPDMGE